MAEMTEKAVIVKLSSSLERTFDMILKTGLYGDTPDEIAANLIRLAIRNEISLGLLEMEEDDGKS